MDIKDLKKAWNELSEKTAEQQMLSGEQIRSLLERKTTSLLDRIDRNIRIGFVVLVGIIALIIIADVVSLKKPSFAGEVPGWIVAMDSVASLFFIALFVTFIIHYLKIRRQCRGVCDLRHTLLKTIGVLTYYQRLFTLALVIILLESATGFIAGFYNSIREYNTTEGFLLPVLAIGFLMLVLFSGLLFFLLRWSFRRIFGNYLRRLRETLAELDELE